jgi:hypothetical protein
MGFLKAVKTGQSGPQFGAALAAAGVVLIDFVSNWLLKRVRGAASKVAAKVKEIAKKIGRKLKAATKKLGGKFGKVKDNYFGKKGDKGKGKEGDRHKDKDNKEGKEQNNNEMITEVRGPIDKASDKVIDKEVKVANKVGDKFKSGKGKGKKNKDKSKKNKDKTENRNLSSKEQKDRTKNRKDKTRDTNNKAENRNDRSKDKNNKVKDNNDKKTKDGQSDERTIKQKEADLDKALAEGYKLIKDDKLSSDEVKKLLPNIKSRYRMTYCKLVIDKETEETITAHVKGKINPRGSSPSGTKRKPIVRGQEERFQEAQHQNKFHGNFTLEDWSTHFRLGSKSTASGDMDWGLTKNKVKRVKRGHYQLTTLSFDEIVEIAKQMINLNGRKSLQLGAPKPHFNLEDVKNFCVSSVRLPNDPKIYTRPILDKIVKDLEASKNVEQVSTPSNAYRFLSLPPERIIPNSWKVEKDIVRRKYYINGSGFDSARKTVIDRDFKKIKAAINLLGSMNEEDQKAGKKKWDSLYQTDMVPDENWQSGKNYFDQSLYNVDHDEPLAKHWCTGGNNTKWEVRQNIAGNVNNLQLMVASENKSKQAEGHHYKDMWWVGPDFTGPGTRKGPEWADETTKFQNML